ncbi:unnamed protein product [Mesocestoides corti]|uniref:Uncharacterized protein n=1 Tax=Mesocestoides corti TaxID=53468 RepID=A0A0R3U4K7_MESCO|nr:unnamed protein product [Mesocestoides corti]
MEDKNEAVRVMEAGGVGWAGAVNLALTVHSGGGGGEGGGTYYDDEIYASVGMRTLFQRIAESVCANIVPAGFNPKLARYIQQRGAFENAYRFLPKLSSAASRSRDRETNSMEHGFTE